MKEVDEPRNEENDPGNEGDDITPNDEQIEESAETMPVPPLRKSTKDVILDCGILDAQGERLREATVSRLKGSDRKDIGKRENLQNGGKLVTQLLFNKVTAIKGLKLSDPEQKLRIIQGMLSADRTRLMLQIYQLSKNRDYLTVTVVCENSRCEATNEVDFNIIDFPFKPFRFFTRDPQKNMFVFSVEFDDEDEIPHKAVFRYPNGYDEERTIPLVKKNPVEAGHLMLQRCIVSYDGSDVISTTFIDDLDTSELDPLQAAFSDKLPGIELSPEMTCYDCNESATVMVDIADFLFGKSSKAKKKSTTTFG